MFSLWIEESLPSVPKLQAAQGWTNRTLAVHERVDSRFLLLPGNESTITEITEYIYFSPLKPVRESDIKVSKILYQ